MKGFLILNNFALFYLVIILLSIFIAIVDTVLVNSTSFYLLREYDVGIVLSIDIFLFEFSTFLSHMVTFSCFVTFRFNR